MASTKKLNPTPMLDELESGPWPSFVTGLKRLADDNNMMVDLLGQLEHSYETRTGYWKGGTVGVFELLDDDGKPRFPESSEFHTLRVMPPPGWHYDTNTLREMCNIWEKRGSGLIAFHGQSGDIMFQGCTTENVQKAFDDLNELGFDLGGAGPALRTAASCVGHARCEMSCYDEPKAHREIINTYLDDMHRPSLPYKFKFKFSGCANDCMNAVQRADFAVIGTWKDDMKVDQAEVQAYVGRKGRKYVIDNIISRCPTNALSLNDDDTLDVDNKSCVRCMHCLNVMTTALAPGDEKGATILIGGKRTLKIGDLMGTVIVPFMKLESDEDYEALTELGGRVIDFFAENALEHERTGEMIERIGLANFIEGIGVEIDPNMITHPRTNPYVRADGWDEEAEKWFARKKAG